MSLLMNWVVLSTSTSMLLSGGHSAMTQPLYSFACRYFQMPVRSTLPWPRCVFSGGLIIQDIYNNNWTKLVDLNETIILWTMKKLDIQRPTTRSSNLDCKGKGSDYVLQLAQKSGADTYLSGIHGKDYLNTESFQAKRIKLSFQNFQHPIYKQQHNQPFVSNLCTLDALFNIGKEATKKLISSQ